MKCYTLFIGCFLLLLSHVYGQNLQCPQNIGFETGTLQNWQAYTGLIDQSTGIITLSPSIPTPGRHTVIKYQNNQLDPYGKFPMTCPNGSLYSLKLGNDGVGKQAERVSYTFTVPSSQNYSLIYNYAVVFQNPDHAGFEQPKFTARVFDVASNQYVNCGSFEFVASSGLPGFQQSSFGNGVVFKPWAPITINLFGYAGKTLRLEFTTNDCTRGGHFGYAYVDVNENCASPITGNTYCAGNSFLKMSAPAGFQSYTWYNEDFSQILGTSNVLTVTPAPPDQTHYALKITPFPGLGCEDTLYTTAIASNDVLNLKVKGSVSGCESGVSLKDESLTEGSSPNLNFSYFTNAEATEYVPDPTQIISSGTYYIQAVNAAGCSDIKPIQVLLEKSPSILITNPDPVCLPGKVDLTQTKITAGSSLALTYSYWKDENATIALKNPQAVDSAGTYYIKGVNTIGCSAIVPVKAVIGTLPNLIIDNPVACTSVDLTNIAVTARSDGNLAYTYYTDAAATNALTAPNAVTKGGQYYIKATNAAGCYVVKPVYAQVYGLPSINIIPPLPVVFPATVDVTKTYVASDSLTYSFWKDPATTIALENPDAVSVSGTFYIKAANKASCTVILPVKVVVNPPPVVKIIAPNTFTPNADGTNDYFKIDLEGVLQLNYLRIFNRYGKQVFETKQLTDYWDGTFNGTKIPFGTYYWVIDGSDNYRKERVTKSGSITLIR